MCNPISKELEIKPLRNDMSHNNFMNPNFIYNRKQKSNSEFDGSNMSHKTWDREMFTTVLQSAYMREPRRPVVREEMSHFCVMEDFSCSFFHTV